MKLKLQSLLIRVEINMPLMLMIMAVLISATAVIYSTHINRYNFIQLQRLEKQRDQLDAQWGRLLLEESTLGSPRRVERKAKNNLQMFLPNEYAAVDISHE